MRSIKNVLLFFLLLAAASTTLANEAQIRKALAQKLDAARIEGVAPAPIPGLWEVRYRTPDGVTSNVMEKLGQDWDGWTAHDDTYVADGENVVVLARYTAVNKATGKPIDVRVAHHFVVRGELIVRFEQFVDTALVRDAMTD